MVGTIIYKVITIKCDPSTINVSFYLLDVPYPHQKSVGIVELFYFHSTFTLFGDRF